MRLTAAINVVTYGVIAAVICVCLALDNTNVEFSGFGRMHYQHTEGCLCSPRSYFVYRAFLVKSRAIEKTVRDASKLSLAFATGESSKRTREGGALIQVWQEGVERFGEDGRVWGNLARAFLINGQVNDARASIDRAIKLEPTDCVEWLTGFAAYREDRGKAQMYLDNAVHFCPSITQSEMWKELQVSDPSVTQSAIADQQRLGCSSQISLCSAWFLISMGKLEPAQQALERIVQQNPTLADAWLLKAEIAANQKNCSTAGLFIKRAMYLNELKPENKPKGAEMLTTLMPSVSDHERKIELRLHFIRSGLRDDDIVPRGFLTYVSPRSDNLLCAGTSDNYGLATP